MNPHYLTFCIQQALYRPEEYVPSRLAYLVICMGIHQFDGVTKWHNFRRGSMTLESCPLESVGG